MTVIHITFDQQTYNHHRAHELLAKLAGHIKTATKTDHHPTVSIGTAGRTHWWGDVDLHATNVPSTELRQLIDECCPDKTGMQVNVSN